MKWKRLGLISIISFGLLFILVLSPAGNDASRPANEWQSELWMQKDTILPNIVPARLLALTDLPPLFPKPTSDDILAAITKSKQAGCNAAVLSFSWPSLEPQQDAFTLDELKSSVVINKGRFLFLGLQVLNTTVKDLPADLEGKRFDDPLVLERFRSLLDTLAPFLRNRVRYLSLGNESDIYLSAHPEEIEAFSVFLNSAHQHLKIIAPKLTVSTTLTDAGALQPEFQDLIKQMDAHFLTYYHGQHGLEGRFKDASKVKAEIITLATKLDGRPIVFQEIGFPANEALGSSPQKQAEFIEGVFDAWDELDSRVPLINYFMMYDFPEEFVKEQVSYYGITNDAEPLVKFMSSLGLHKADGTPRPGWKVFKHRGNQIK